jgi:hypothetical protein
VGCGQMIARNAPKKRHRRRRLHPVRVQRWFLELAEEERLEEYACRWQSFTDECAASASILARAVEVLARAEARLLGLDPPTLTFGEREARGLALAERFVARYWRRRPCTAFAGWRLPRIATSAYFDTPADAIHWLDLETRLVCEALVHELRMLKRRVSLVGDLDGLDRLLLEDVGDQLVADPAVGVRAPLVHRVLVELTTLAHHAPMRSTRQRAADWLERIDRAMRPDFRSCCHRDHHSRFSTRRGALLELVAAVCEEQDTFRTWCEQQGQVLLPLALRAPSRPG